MIRYDKIINQVENMTNGIQLPFVLKYKMLNP